MVRSLKIDNHQFGTKVGKHLRDFGRDPGKPENRVWIKGYIEDIYLNPTEIRDGTFAGQGDLLPDGSHARGPVWFYAQGSDVIVVDKNDTFVTILKNGTTLNTSYLNATVLAGRP